MRFGVLFWSVETASLGFYIMVKQFTAFVVIKIAITKIPVSVAPLTRVFGS